MSSKYYIKYQKKESFIFMVDLQNTNVLYMDTISFYMEVQ